MSSLFGLQIQRSLSRSNSVIRTASGCSSISSSHHTAIYRNHPLEHRIPRSQQRYTSGVRSLSHPTDLASFCLPRKTSTESAPRRASRAAARDEEYEETEDVEDEWADAPYKRTEAKEVEAERYEVEDFEETQPNFAASFLPYFQKPKQDQFKETEELATDNLNQQAQRKYTKAVERRDSPKGPSPRYRLEASRRRVVQHGEDRETVNVADVYREQYMKREQTFFAHLQPSNMKPFGSNDSLFFPLKTNKPEYSIFKKFDPQAETDDASAARGKAAPSQQREYSTVTNKKKHHRMSSGAELRKKSSPTYARVYSSTALRKKKSDTNKQRDSKEVKDERSKTRKLSGLHPKANPESAKESRRDKQRYHERDARYRVTSFYEPSPKPTFASLQSRKQSSQMQATETVAPSSKATTNVVGDFKEIESKAKAQKKPLQAGSVEEKQVIDRALNFAHKYRDIYLNSTGGQIEPGRSEAPLPAPKEFRKSKHSKREQSVNFLVTPKAQVAVKTTSKLNLLQGSATPEEAMMLDVKPGKDERFSAPWPAYSETVRTPKPPPTNFIKFPPQVLPKQTKTAPIKAEAPQAREYSTGLVRKRRSAKKVKRSTFRTSHLTQALSRMFGLPVSQRPYSKAAKKKSAKKKEPEDEVEDPLPILDRPDCAKPKERPLKDCPPLARLKPRKIKPKKCVPKKPQDICAPRADEGMKIKQKKLRSIVPGKCNPEKVKMKDCAPLKRLKKVPMPEPPKCVIVAQVCGDRADDDLVMKKKKLPILEPEDCPKPEPFKMKDIKLPRLKKVEMPEPKKVCPKGDDFCPPTRADDSLKDKPKSLPVLAAPDCPQVPPEPMKDVALPRLKKVPVKEPPKVCPKPDDICADRADEGLKVQSKTLPCLEPLECPKPKSRPMKDCKPLERLPKPEPYDPPKCKIPKGFECPPRADGNLKVQAKSLPELIPHDDCKPIPSKLKDCEPLARLPKRHVPPPPRCTIAKDDICSKRADEGMVLEKRRLPLLEAPDCPKPEPRPMKDVSLPRLEKFCIPEPPKVCKVEFTCADAVRADDSLKPKEKSLPVLEMMDCPKVPPLPMKDSKPLSRLQKITIKEPPKVCPKPDQFCAERADKGLKVKSKTLPVLEIPECEKPPSTPMKEGCPLVRLPRMEKFDPPKCKIPKKFECPPRADEGLKVGSKSLPELLAHEDCKPKPMKMKDCKPLKRPKKTPVPEPKRCVVKGIDFCAKRADQGLKLKKKKLPVLEAPDCPKVPPRPMKDIVLPRLKKVEVKPPPRVCAVVKDICAERADEGLKIQKKKLPELEAPDCPKVPPEPMKDVKLPRLKKVEVKEPARVCPVEEDICADRADDVTGYKIKKKPLKTVILSRKYNEISFRQFRKGKKKKKAPYFSEKRKYSSYIISRAYSSRGCYRAKRKAKCRAMVYRRSSQCCKKPPKDEGRCCPQKPICPIKPKTFWQKVCDYFKARPGCPPPDAWKKKLLREKAEKAAKAAGLHLCECPCVGKPQITIKKKTCCPPKCKKKKGQCPKFKMPHCNDANDSLCIRTPTPIDCDPPRETPYPSFSEWQREMKARKMSECQVAEQKAKGTRNKLKAMSKQSKKRCYSTMSSDFLENISLQKRRATKILEELDKELEIQSDENVKLLCREC